jgi:hypothetical protein
VALEDDLIGHFDLPLEVHLLICRSTGGVSKEAYTSSTESDAHFWVDGLSQHRGMGEQARYPRRAGKRKKGREYCASWFFIERWRPPAPGFLLRKK